MTADELLIVDDLMLLLMDDDGASVQGAGTLHYTLGGAVLTELALLGRVETDDTGIVNGPRVTPAGAGPLPDPLLQSAYETVAEKIRRVQPLLLALGGDLWRVVRDRLVERGLLRREESRWLGVFRSTRWPADDERHEAHVEQGMRPVRGSWAKQRRPAVRPSRARTRTSPVREHVTPALDTVSP